MYPVLIDIAGLKIQSYGLLIALGYVAAVWLSRRLANQEGLPPGDYSDLAFLALVTGVLGGRAFFVLTNLSHFTQHPEQILQFWSGGLVFYGGFLVAFPVCTYFLRAKKLPLWRSLDLLAPGLALGHAIGRIGCFLAGCCQGGVCPYPWGVVFHSELVDPAIPQGPLHPTQLYETFGLFLITGGLLWWRRKKPKAGYATAAYLCSYAVLRFIVELFRGDDIRGFIPGTPLSTSQGVAIALFLFGFGLAGRRFRSNH